MLVVLLCGIPGTGKSSFARHLETAARLAGFDSHVLAFDQIERCLNTVPGGDGRLIRDDTTFGRVRQAALREMKERLRPVFCSKCCTEIVTLAATKETHSGRSLGINSNGNNDVLEDGHSKLESILIVDDIMHLRSMRREVYVAVRDCTAEGCATMLQSSTSRDEIPLAENDSIGGVGGAGNGDTDVDSDSGIRRGEAVDDDWVSGPPSGVPLLVVWVDTPLTCAVERNKARGGYARVEDRAFCAIVESFEPPDATHVTDRFNLVVDGSTPESVHAAVETVILELPAIYNRQHQRQLQSMVYERSARLQRLARQQSSHAVSSRVSPGSIDGELPRSIDLQFIDQSLRKVVGITTRCLFRAAAESLSPASANTRTGSSDTSSGSADKGFANNAESNAKAKAGAFTRREEKISQIQGGRDTRALHQKALSRLVADAKAAVVELARDKKQRGELEPRRGWFLTEFEKQLVSSLISFISCCQGPLFSSGETEQDAGETRKEEGVRHVDCLHSDKIGAAQCEDTHMTSALVSAVREALSSHAVRQCL